jgi:nucleoside-diphosphate-sugar epimerase
MRVLYIGGSGNISWRCVSQSIEMGHEVWVLNRGASNPKRRSLPDTVRRLQSDIRKPESVSEAISDARFDSVIDFTCYLPEHAYTALKLFGGRTDQFIFISSTASYQKPTLKLPYTEETPLSNPYWLYARNKAECERIFLTALRDDGFPVTIVRPGHTYDTIIPVAVGNADWTIPARLLSGRPIPLHGDGNTLWTLTHSEDFACALAGLISRPDVIGQTFHITSDEWLTWRRITEILAEVLDVPIPDFVYVPTSEIYKRDQWLGQTILGHKSWCDLYDNSKIKAFLPDWAAHIPYPDGIRKTLQWFDQDQARKFVDPEMDGFLDQLCIDFG